MLSVAFQLTQLTSTSWYHCSTFERLLLLRRSKLTNSSTKWQSPRRIVEVNRRIILSLPTDLIQCSVLRICSDSRLICLFISSSIAQFHDPLGRPTAFLDFLHSLPQPHETCRISLLMMVLSHSDTHYLNRHMIGCGCPEPS